MTSVVGLDVGNMASKIGLARKRGIDIIANEVSNRATPFVFLFFLPLFDSSTCFFFMILLFLT
jgi:hypothetical protein